MSVHFQVDSFDYAVAMGMVKATATIGNAQAGAWRMTLDDKELAKGTTPVPVKVGSAAAVKGKRLMVYITSVDVNPTTNEMAVEVALTGGAKPNTFEQDFDDGDSGDTTVFTFIVDLV